MSSNNEHNDTPTSSASDLLGRAEPAQGQPTGAEGQGEVEQRVETLLEKTEAELAEEAIAESSRDLHLSQLELGHHAQPDRQYFRQGTMIAAMAVALFYIGFRAFWTLNLATPFAITFSAFLLVAEAYGIVVLGLYFFQIWKLHEPEVLPPLANKKIDVFVPTFNEDVSLLRGTLMACKEMDYDHTTYVLDDGDRNEVKQLAEELGVEYIARKEHDHAKAGNLNHALEQTDGEFVVVLDADHVPLRHFLRRLIGYFKDEELAFVQVPHTTYNLDNYQGSWTAASRAYWEDEHLFFEAVQLGKNHWNSVCFCGSAAMFRRKAMQEVGYMATETITEDLHTGMRMHANGWKSLAVSEQLVAGLAPEDAATFSQQRLRWGEGNLSVMAYDNPLTMKGLTWYQRVNYLASMLNWTYGPARAVVYVVPIVMLLTGIAPLRPMGWMYFAIVAAYLIITWSAVKIASNGCGRLLGIEAAMMASFWLHFKAVLRASFLKRYQKFIVTVKRGAQHEPKMRHVLPQATIAVFGVIALCWAAGRIAFGLSADWLGFTIGAALVTYHGYLGFRTTLRGIRKKAIRASWRHPARLFAEYKLLGKGKESPSEQAVTIDINESGCSILASERLEANTELNLTIHSPVQTVECRGYVETPPKIVGASERHPLGYFHHIRFSSAELKQISGLWTIAMQYVVPGIVATYFFRRTARLGAIVKKLRSTIDAARGTAKIELPLPLQISGDDEYTPRQYTIVESLTKDEVVCSLNHLLTPGDIVLLELSTPHGRLPLHATVRSADTVRVGAAIEHRHVLDIIETAGSCTDELRQLIWDARSNRWVKAFRATEPVPMTRIHWPAARQLSAVAAACLLVAAGLFWGMYHTDLALMSASDVAIAGDDTQRVSQMAASAMQSNWTSSPRVLRAYNASVALGDDQAAADAAAELAVRYPDNRLSWLLTEARHRAMALQHDEAEQLFDAVLASKTDWNSPTEQAEVYVEAARNALARNDIDKATALFSQAMSLQSANSGLIAEFIGILVSQGNITFALQILDQMDATDDVLRLRIGLYDMAQRADEAMPLMEEMLRRHPNDHLLQKRMAEVAFDTKDYQRSAELYNEVVQARTDDAEMTGRLAEAETELARRLVEQGRHREAVQWFKMALEREPSTERSIEMADAMTASGDLESAIKSLEYLEDETALARRAAFLDMAKRYEDAAVAYEALLRRQGDSPEALRKLASAYEAADLPSGGEAAIRRLEKIDTLQRDDEIQLARMLLAQGNYEDARLEMDDVVAADLEDNEVWRLYINILAGVEELTQAEHQNVNRIVDDLNENDYPGLTVDDFERLGDVLSKVPEAARMSDMLSAAVAEYPDSRYLRLRLANLLMMEGEYDQAERHFTYLLEQPM